MTLPRQDDPIRRFRSGLAALRRRRRFIPYGEAPAFARDLRGLLDLTASPTTDPRTGAELVAAFFRADAAAFEACDDSDGLVGDVFRMAARDRFTDLASRCDDKAWIADLLFSLLESDEYGVRDSLLDHAARFLPAPVLRSLADRMWAAAHAGSSGHQRERQRIERVRWLALTGQVARQLRDPELFERALLAHWPDAGPAACVDIAEAWLEAGDATTALGWLERIPPEERFLAYQRDRLLGEVFRRLGRHEDLEALLRRRFLAEPGRETLEDLLEVVAPERREEAIAAATRAIFAADEFASRSAAFLVENERTSDAARYVVQHRARIDGDDWTNLPSLARNLTRAGQSLAATVIYRALLDAILARARTAAYPAGARHLRELARLAGEIADWDGLPTHDEYRTTLRERHGRKVSFWKRVGDGA